MVRDWRASGRTANCMSNAESGIQRPVQTLVGTTLPSRLLVRHGGRGYPILMEEYGFDTADAIGTADDGETLCHLARRLFSG